jgi:predicted transcriptional regulator
MVKINHRILEIPIDAIVIPPNRFTSRINLDWLCRNIAVSEFIMPVVVKKSKDRKQYILVDGYNRLMCLKRMNVTTVPAIIIDSDSVEYINMLINYVRGKRCGWDVLVGINELLLEGIDTDKIASLLGRSKGTIKNYISAYRQLLLKLKPEEVELIKESCVNLKTLVTCSHEDNVMDCILRRVKPVQQEGINARKIAMEISKHIEIAIKQGVDVELLKRKIIEAINEAIQLSLINKVGRHES